jgi:LAO/AO transport system kinase
MTDAELVAGVVAGDRRAVARAMSRVEAEPGGDLASALHHYGGRAHIVGVTGAPGAGKSSLVAALITAWRQVGRTVGVVAVDPSSPYGGGAVLGDRVRMEHHYADTGVFVRSMATRGQLGGLAQAAADTVTVLDAAGFDLVALETAGVGQADVAVADECHTTLVVVTPGTGDDIQALKAGLLEIADVYVVNKADQPGADAAAGYLAAALGLATSGPALDWPPPIVRTVATTGAGVDDLAGAVDAHAAFLHAGDGWTTREARRAAAELRRRLFARLVAPLLAQTEPGGAGHEVVRRLAARAMTPAEAVESLLQTRAAIEAPHFREG